LGAYEVEEFAAADEEFCTHAAFIGAGIAFRLEVPLAALARYVHNLQCRRTIRRESPEVPLGRRF
jgi:hypothetical protein